MSNITANCPLCYGDGIIDMGDRYREGFAPEAWVRTCECSVDERQDDYGWQEILAEATSRGALDVLKGFAEEHSRKIDETVAAWDDWLERNP
jgi:hypothetical protein